MNIFHSSRKEVVYRPLRGVPCLVGLHVKSGDWILFARVCILTLRSGHSSCNFVTNCLASSSRTSLVIIPWSVGVKGTEAAASDSDESVERFGGEGFGDVLSPLESYCVVTRRFLLKLVFMLLMRFCGGLKASRDRK